MIWNVVTEHGSAVLREQLEPEDEPGLLDLFAACTDWFEAVTGSPPGFGDVQSLFYALPEGASFDDKRLFTVRDGDRIVGLIDVVTRHPTSRSCSVGLFLLAPSHRGRGLGRAVAQVLLDEARLAGMERVTTTAADNWPAGQSFLRSLGFVVGDLTSPSGNRTTWAGESPVRQATLTLA